MSIMPEDAPLFVSYSRRDYYFAESLAFHLIEQKIPAWLDVKDLRPGKHWQRDLTTALDAAPVVVLIGSPHAFKSANVRAEWQRTLARGTRIVIVCFRRARLPNELKECQLIDFRGSFRQALTRLIAILHDSEISNHDKITIPLIPPWVAVTACCLAVPTIGYLWFASWSASSETSPLVNSSLGMLEDTIVNLISALIGLSLLVWFAGVAFLYRRMSMTRLALTLAALALIMGYPLGMYFFAGPDSLANHNAQFIASILYNWPLVFTLAAVPLIGLLIITLVRPEDLLRWSPTGKVWSGYRIGHAAKGSNEVVDAPTAFGAVQRFVLLHDALDGHAAARLRHDLISAGASEVNQEGVEVTTILLLTQLTSVAFINQRLGPESELLVVIGTGIHRPQMLDWLWHRQWIDFRSWGMQRPEREQGLPKVPEALEQLRLPKDVQSMHQLMCSLIGLLFATTSAAHPDLGSYSEAAFATMTATQRLDAAHTLLVAGLLMGYVLLARWLLTRRISQAKYTRMFSLVFTFAAAMEGWDLYHLALAHDAPWRLIPAVCFLVFAPLWYWRNHKRLVFWFPQVDMEKVNNPIQQNARTSWQSWARPLVQILLRGPIHGVKRLNRGKQLGAKRNWHTLTWSSVHVFLWMFILVLAG